MDLGEQIELADFVEDEPGELVIAKKIIGHAVKNITERSVGFERLTIRCKSKGRGHYEIIGLLRLADRDIHSEAEDTNKFFALDSCLKKLQGQID